LLDPVAQPLALLRREPFAGLPAFAEAHAGLFEAVKLALLLGVDPKAVHAWYLAVYVDAVEWVELPNTLGMSQYGDGGVMASKPYVATGQYIQRMGGPCDRCAFDPTKRTGERACPFTTLYWDFLMRHEARLLGNPRMALQVRNLARLSAEERTAMLAVLGQDSLDALTRAAVPAVIQRLEALDLLFQPD